jgi:hypothetical protein
VIERIEGVPIAVAIDRRARRLAALESSERILGGRDARSLEPGGDLGERHRATVLEQGDDQERVVVRLGVIAHRG